KKLRNEMTQEEYLLWQEIRRRQINGVRFLRQKVIGNYIVDFVSLEKKLIIELDGSQHSEQIEYDNKRTSFLKQQGFQVVRFWNSEVVYEMDMVLEILWNLTTTEE
ncbi:endonuclease domain-containing protein, partial [Phocoenobacter atlanticus]